MSLFIEKETETDFSFDEEALAKEVTDYAIEHEGFPFEAEINLTLTDNDGIHAINKEYRDIDAPTDVLSFPMLSYESARYGDYNMLMVLCMMTGIVIIFCNILGEIINEKIDPRIKANEITERSEVSYGDGQ